MDLPAVASPVLGAFIVVFFGGRQVGRIEAAVSRLLRLEASVTRAAEKLDGHDRRIGLLEDVVLKMRASSRPSPTDP